MDFLEQIKSLSDEELKETVETRIKELEELSNTENDNIDTIGYVVDYNPSNYKIDELAPLPVDIVYTYSGYIKKGMRIVFGMNYSIPHFIVSNDGSYYYVDDDSYILDFCKYVKDAEIENEYELFSYILEFINYYFGTVKDIERGEMLKMITKSGRNYYNPVEEHTFTTFRGRGNAMCTEYALMAGNILNVFGFETSFALGKLEVEKDTKGPHAFNIIGFTDEESGEEINAIIDFSYPIKIYDINYNIIDKSPFIGELELNDEELKECISNCDNTFTYKNYSYIMIGERIFKLDYDVNRHYNLSNEFKIEVNFTKKKQ